MRMNTYSTFLELTKQLTKIRVDERSGIGMGMKQV